MSKLESVQSMAKAAAMLVIEKAPATIQSLQDALTQHFALEQSLSTIRQSFVAAAGAEAVNRMTPTNPVVETAVTITLDAVDRIVSDLLILEQYVTLTIPKMEDGNNFGVTVQLTALKAMQDAREKLDKAVDDLSKYSGSRADALEKCKLGNKNQTTSTTSTESSSTGKDKEKGDTGTQVSSTAKETKTIETAAVEGPEALLRKQAVVAVDVLFYGKAKNLFISAMTSYLAAIDFLDKNEQKIDAPKGSGGGRGAHFSMY